MLFNGSLMGVVSFYEMLFSIDHALCLCLSYSPGSCYAAWKVLDKELLVEVVIPKYFVQTKYESFTRQLSGWGFKRLHQTGPDYRCYYHEW